MPSIAVSVSGFVSGLGFLPVIAVACCPAELTAQVPGSSAPPNPASSPAEPPAASPAHAPDPQLPPNVSITTPDGKPLSPEVLKKVIDLLKQDPALHVGSGPSTATVVRRSVGGTDIVVTARPLRGSVLGSIPPIQTFNLIDVRGYGAATIGDLVGALGNELTSTYGAGERRPILLLNGRRITSFDEIALYPTEAIERLEVFPEALALQYGFQANQKVVNIVTFKYFRQRNVRLSYDQPTAGGHGDNSNDFQILRIADRTRVNLRVGLEQVSGLLESQRGIIEPPEAIGQASYRTLIPSSRTLSANGSLSGTLFGNVSYTARAGTLFGKTKALLGRESEGTLNQVIDRQQSNFGAIFSGQVRKWLWTSNSTFSLDTSTATNRIDGTKAATSSSHSRSEELTSDFVLTGGLFKAPAGSALATFRGYYDRQHVSASLPGSGADLSSFLARNQVGASASISVPLKTRSVSERVAIGDLSLTGNVGVQRSTGRREAVDYGYGLFWTPISQVNFRVSRDTRTIIPTLNQIGGTVLVSPNVRVFDLARGETRDVTLISGGNINLENEKRQVSNVGFTLKPFRQRNVSLFLEYTDVRRSNPIETFHVFSQQVQSGLPARFGYSAAGQLLTADVRPINLYKSDESKLSWGFNLTKSLASPSVENKLIFAPASDGPPPPGLLPPNTKIIDNPPGTPIPPEIQNAISRIFFSLYHTWRLRSVVTLSADGPTLDLLSGSALNALGERPRHEITASGGIFRRGLGARTNIRWQSANTVFGAATQPAGGARLRFVYKPVVDLHFTLNPEDRVVGVIPSWVKGVQVTLDLTNVLNLRPVVRDQAGETPLDYQAGYLDPIGRSIKISLRKLF